MNRSTLDYIKSSTKSLIELSTTHRKLLTDLGINTVEDFLNYEFSQAGLKQLTIVRLERYQSDILKKVQVSQISGESQNNTETEADLSPDSNDDAEERKPFVINLDQGAYNPGECLNLMWRRQDDREPKQDLYVPWSSLDRHAFVCGSTGSGKTVLLKSLLEQAALFGIPSIVFDPGGDLGYLSLRSQWLENKSDIKRVGTELADQVFVSEKSPERIQKFLEDIADQNDRRVGGGISKEYLHSLDEKTFIRIFSPRSNRHGISLSVPPFREDTLQKLDVESEDEYDDRLDEIITTLLLSLEITGARKGRISTVLKSLMKKISGKLGAQPLDELLAVWGKVEEYIPSLRGVDLEDFLKGDDKVEFQRSLIGYLEGTGAGWLRGCKLDFDKILRPIGGQTPINVIYVGHLSIEDQQYVMARVTSELDKWMRVSPTPNDKLKLLLAIDELGGSGGKESFFPPSAKPISKPPLMRLVRQARKYGCGLVFATQNVKDIDYKGLGNISNWFVGQLKNAREHQYIGEGMGSSLIEGSQIDRREISGLLPQLKQGMFINVNAEGQARTFKAGYIGSLHMRPSLEFYEAWLAHFEDEAKQAAADYIAGKNFIEEIRYLTYGPFEDELCQLLFNAALDTKVSFSAWSYLLDFSSEYESKFVGWLWFIRKEISSEDLLNFCNLSLSSDTKEEIDKIRALSLLATDMPDDEQSKQMPVFSKNPRWKKYVDFLLSWKLPKEELNSWNVCSDEEALYFENKDLSSIKPEEDSAKRRNKLRACFSKHIESLNKEQIEQLFGKNEEGMAGDKPNVSVESLLARLVTGSVELINDLQLKRACHEYMSSLSPEGFEFFVADLMRSMGWQAQLTRQSADDGVDVLCVNEEGLRCAVQCKRYSKKVSVEMVRELEGAKVLFNCDEAILATTDTFTANAYDTADKLNIKLLNGDLIAFHAAPLLNLN